ncbi:MAG: TorF family putative porin [Gammaproteobacteria bacterium]|nr:TorF family putative porin [Gammaproteobacteria bacterium]
MKAIQKLTPSLIVTAIVCGGIVTVPGMAHAELTGNVGVTSNYIWRGVTQTSDASAISGGLDYAHASGFYIGTWVSNTVANQYEHDVYLGYGFDAGPVGLDIGALKYIYPVGTVLSDFTEVYVNASYSNFGIGVAYTVDKEDSAITEENDIYVYASAEFEVKKDLALGLLIGDYDVDGGSAGDYTHYQLSLSKDDFTFAYNKNDQNGNAGDARITASWSKNFDL